MKYYLVGAALASVVFTFAACGNSNSPQVLGGPGGPGGPGTVYQQTELFARPAIKEGLEVFNAHDPTNRTEPYMDPTLSSNIQNFMLTVAKRDNNTTNVALSILATDEMVVDLSQNVNTASYLGAETKGFTGSKFGGRALNDDAIDLDLGVVFGNTLAKLGLVADDGKESPCLTTDNVAAQNANNGPFPFVDPPV